ncbi:MAG: gluconate 2-dehydrogenase subunit 3 family protein [Acidobacteriota bacterium]
MTTAEHHPVLEAVVHHILPSACAASVATFIVARLDDDGREGNDGRDGNRFAGNAPLMLAVLEELGESRFSNLDQAEREAALRHIETNDNPYLVHGLRMLLQLILEGGLGDPRHGGNPDGITWRRLGLPPSGPERCLEPENP